MRPRVEIENEDHASVTCLPAGSAQPCFRFFRPVQVLVRAYAHCHRAVCQNGIINAEGMSLKPKGSILIVSMLVMVVSCGAGVWYAVKPQVVPASLRLIGSLFGTQMSLTNKDYELYHDHGSDILSGPDQ